jgi:23S rRNA (adenine2503-C2)-methyltransferase
MTIPHTDLKVLDTIAGSDSVTKFIVEFEDELVGEVTRIINPNKDCVCCPTQTACAMGCKFCFLTNERTKLVLRSLNAREMVGLVNAAVKDFDYRKPLLVSFMGAGEPLLNADAMLIAMRSLREQFGYENVRFAFATMIPFGRELDFLRVVDSVGTTGLNVKCHFSLHFTKDETRIEYMPAAGYIKTGLTLLETYNRVTGSPVEVHYSLMDGVNDTHQDVARLGTLLYGRSIPVKVLHYNSNPTLAAKASALPGYFVAQLKEQGLEAEFYKPNGRDVGASCGQFNLDRYVRRSK